MASFCWRISCYNGYKRLRLAVVPLCKTHWKSVPCNESLIYENELMSTYLTSPMSGWTFCNSLRCFKMKFPTSKAFFCNPSSSTTSNTAWAISHDTGLPPNWNKINSCYSCLTQIVHGRSVILCEHWGLASHKGEPTVLKYVAPVKVNESAISCVVTTSEMGWPFAIGLPIVTISGTTPAWKKVLTKSSTKIWTKNYRKGLPCPSNTQKLPPILPNPVWTSSAMHTPPASRICL